MASIRLADLPSELQRDRSVIELFEVNLQIFVELKPDKHGCFRVCCKCPCVMCVDKRAFDLTNARWQKYKADHGIQCEPNVPSVRVDGSTAICITLSDPILGQDARLRIHNAITSAAARREISQQTALESGMQLMADNIHESPLQDMFSCLHVFRKPWGTRIPERGLPLIRTSPVYIDPCTHQGVFASRDFVQAWPIIGVAGVLYPAEYNTDWTEPEFILQENARSRYKISVEDDAYSNMSKYIRGATTPDEANVCLEWFAHGSFAIVVTLRAIRSGEELRYSQ